MSPPRFGSPHRHYRRTDSTNVRARELAEAGGPSGLVVTAEQQEAGRGRRGHPWFAPPGTALLYSALLRPLGERPLLPLAVPLAVCEAAESLAPVECAVKWPNDVWVRDRKVAGVLIESRAGRGGEGWAVIGVGLNVAVPPDAFPPELRQTAASLLLPEPGPSPSAREDPSVEAALRALNESLGRWIEVPGGEVAEAYRRRDALRGRRISWEEGSGVAEGIDDRGHLVVRTDSGERSRLGAGEVHLALER